MRFFNRHRRGIDSEAGALPVLDSSNVYTLHLEGSLATHFSVANALFRPIREASEITVTMTSF